MSENTEQSEARRLIESALADMDTGHFVDVCERAEGASAAFRAATTAYARNDLHETAAALDDYTGTAPRALTDLCLSGASLIAEVINELPHECGDADCTGGVRLGAENGSFWAHISLWCVNTMADGDPQVSRDLLSQLDALVGADGLRHIALSLVDIYADVQRMDDRS